MVEHADEAHIGAMAFYPDRFYCAVTTIRNGQFFETIDCTDGPNFANSAEQTYSEAVSFFKTKGFGVKDKNNKLKRLSALGVSLYGIVKDGHFFPIKQEFWEAEGRKEGRKCEAWKNEPSVWELLVTSSDGYIKNIVAEANLVCQTDAATGALAEYLWGAGATIWRSEGKQKSGLGAVANPKHNLAYFKILDGIGSGVILNGKPWEGELHPEMGHTPLRRAKNDDYPGICPRHEDCAEGLASRAAMIERLSAYKVGGKPLKSLRQLDQNELKEHEIWRLEAYYLAELAIVANLVVAPRKIVFAGEIIREHLIDKIREAFRENNNGYPGKEADDGLEPEQLIVSGQFLGHDASLLGSLEFARRQAFPSERQSHGLRVLEGPNHKSGPTSGSGFEKSISDMKTERIFDHQQSKAGLDSYTTVRTPRQEWVFGLSITESVEWAIGRATEGRLDDGTIQDGVLCKIDPGLMPIEGQPTIVLQRELQEGLKRLYVERPALFSSDRPIAGIGVSTIGVVAPNELWLESIARKPWKSLKGNGPIVDFGELFALKSGRNYIFEIARDTSKIIVQNDAPARCLTEYLYGFDADKRPESLLYLMVGEGVNGAYVSEGDLPHMLRHPEIGHCRPVLSEGDQATNFDSITGCPAHVLCFEGVASNARFRREYHCDYWGLSGQEEQTGLETEAWYLSQMVMNGVLSFSPELVLFGGAMMQGPNGDRLIRRVCEAFTLANRGYLPEYRDINSVRDFIRKAKFGDKVRPLSALNLACLGAFGANKFGRALTVKELSRRWGLRAKR